MLPRCVSIGPAGVHCPGPKASQEMARAQWHLQVLLMETMSFSPFFAGADKIYSFVGYILYI